MRAKTKEDWNKKYQKRSVSFRAKNIYEFTYRPWMSWPEVKPEDKISLEELNEIFCL